MRVYKCDGSYVEDNDTEFGWYFYEIIIDESNDKFEEINKETRLISKLKKSFTQTFESIDFTNFEDIKDVPIEQISPDVEIEEAFDVESCSHEDEEFAFDEVDLEFPPKDKLAELINPCSTETKMLLSVIKFSKYSLLLKEETTEELIKRVNVKSTNCKNLINDKRASLSEDMVKEIVNYHATKEDNMMSLMMELILTDVDCSLEDIVDTNEPHKDVDVPQVPQFVIETNDLSNSLPSISSINKSEERLENNYLQVSNRANILSSLGLSEEDKSIQSFCEETFEMHQKLADIKKSFQDYTNKVNDLLKQASALKTDLRETLCLNDIINLLEGDTEKVKLKKLPFRIFYQRIETGDRDINLII